MPLKEGLGVCLPALFTVSPVASPAWRVCSCVYVMSPLTQLAWDRTEIMFPPCSWLLGAAPLRVLGGDTGLAASPAAFMAKHLPWRL